VRRVLERLSVLTVDLDLHCGLPGARFFESALLRMFVESGCSERGLKGCRLRADINGMLAAWYSHIGNISNV
jgi:hypothetical protein